MVVNIIVTYCCTRVLLHAKMLEETESEETTDFLSLVAFRLGGGAAGPLPGYTYGTFQTLIFIITPAVQCN